MKKLMLMLLGLVVATGAFAQENPVTWKQSVKALANGEYEITFTATIKAGWKMYGLKAVKDGPNPTIIAFTKNAGVQLVGNVTEVTKPIVKFDEMFQMEINYFKEKATFTQKVKKIGKGKVVLKANVEWMCCDNGSCIPPDDIDFDIVLQ